MEAVKVSHGEASSTHQFPFVKGLSIYTCEDASSWENIKSTVSTKKLLTTKVTLDWNFEDKIPVEDAIDINPTKLILDNYEGHDWVALVLACKGSFFIS